MRERILLTGWFSFRDGEATAGDVLALRRVQEVLDRARLPYDTAWSPVFQPSALHLDNADPTAYSHLVFVSGPIQGPQVAALHERFAQCRRIAVGTSVVDGDDPAVTGFHRILARDAPAGTPLEDLSARAPALPPKPVVGVILTHGQEEYGQPRRDTEVVDQVTEWLAGKDCARIELQARLDIHDWHLSATPAQFQSLLARLDLVVTDRLHGLVLALRAGIPALAVDPVAGGAKVTAQARACGWPALVAADRLDAGRLERWWDWCLTSGRVAARQIGAEFLEEAAREGTGSPADGTNELVHALETRPARG